MFTIFNGRVRVRKIPRLGRFHVRFVFRLERRSEEVRHLHLATNNFLTSDVTDFVVDDVIRTRDLPSGVVEQVVELFEYLVGTRVGRRLNDGSRRRHGRVEMAAVCGAICWNENQDKVGRNRTSCDSLICRQDCIAGCAYMLMKRLEAPIWSINGRSW